MSFNFTKFFWGASVSALSLLAIPIAQADETAGANDIVINNEFKTIATVGIANFNYQVATNYKLEKIIEEDLLNSGKLSIVSGNKLPQDVNREAINSTTWLSKDVQYLITGQVSNGGQGLQLTYKLFDMTGSMCPIGQACVDKTISLPAVKQRALAHSASNDLFKSLTNVNGDFLSQIAYVRQPVPGVSNYELYVADYDGYNARRVYASTKPLASPDFNYAGNKLAFVAYTTFASVIKEVDINTGAVRDLVVSQANNLAPAYAPNDKYLAYATNVANPNYFNIAVRNLATGRDQLMPSRSRDTEPTWNGSSILFTSDRGGTAGIYQVAVSSLASGAASRVSKAGGQTTNAAVALKENKLVYINRDRVVTQDLKSGALSNISSTYLDESLSVSPNGYMVVYSSSKGNSKVLNIVSIDGQSRTAINKPSGAYFYPTWSKK